jgi:hypothetical protein
MTKTNSRLFGDGSNRDALDQMKAAVSEMLCIKHWPQQTQKRARVGISCHETIGYGQDAAGGMKRQVLPKARLMVVECRRPGGIACAIQH